MSKVLDGIRVLEIAEGWSAAALCGRLLAEFGAEVIKIETAEGDLLRRRKPLAPCGESYDIQLVAANKKSVCIDPALAEDGERLAALRDSADVIVEDSLFAAEHGFRAAFDQLRKSNPALILCSISPFGQSGPLSGFTGNELIAQAMSGMMVTTGFPGDSPTRIGISLGQHASGIIAGIAVLAALCQRVDNGTGQEIDISVHDCLLNYLATFLPGFITTGKNPKRIGNLHPIAAPWNSYQAKDGWVIICTGSDAQWVALAKIIGRDELAQDVRFTTQDQRIASNADIDAIINQWVADKNIADISRLLEAVNIPAGPILTVEALLADEQVSARNMCVKLKHPKGGEVYATGPLFNMTVTPGEISRPAPLLAEHTAAIAVQAPERRNKSEAMQRTTRRALEGIRVLETGVYTGGPLAARLLANLGAEIIKVEPPLKGDPLRDFGCKIEGDAYIYFINNYSKKSITLDTNKMEGKALFLELVQRCDVLVENFAPGALDRWGLGYSRLKEANPSLIYCSASGFGWTGPLGKKRAFDTIGQARGGVLSQTGYPGGPPTKAGASIADVSLALTGALAAVAALYHRKRTGEGQFIDVAMYDILVWMTAEFWPLHFNGEKIPQRMGNAHFRHAPYNTYPAKDGLVAIAAETDKQWNSLLGILDCGPLKDGARFASAEGRVTHRAEVDALVGDWVKSLAARQVVDRCQAVGVPAGPVLELSDIASHPHVRARQMLIEVALHAGHSQKIKLLGCPMKLSASPAEVHQSAPRLGEHNKEIYCELLGHAPAQLDAWKSQGLV